MLNGSLTVWEMFPLFSTVIYFLVDANIPLCETPPPVAHISIICSLRSLLANTFIINTCNLTGDFHNAIYTRAITIPNHSKDFSVFPRLCG
jgi:hypothetical protein